MEGMWTSCGMAERGLKWNTKGLWIIFLEYWRYDDSKLDVAKGKKCVCDIEEREIEYENK